MQSDEPTLVEPIEHELLRASYTSDGKGIDLLLAYATSPHVRYRVLALRGLVRRSSMNDTLWRQSLSDEDVEIRRESVQLFAHDNNESPALSNIVIGMLADSDALVVEGAAFALGEHEYSDAVSELCRVATDHEDARCRESAIAALGSIGDDRGRATILLSLKDKPPIRRRAIVALSNFEGSDIEAALEEAGEDRDWQVRSAVTQLKNQED
jgi:HEAT repeat protein